MQSVTTSPFNLSMLRKTNVWYTIKDGNWNNAATWVSNGVKKYSLPQAGDTVYVNHAITLTATPVHIKNLYISGSITGTASPAITLTIDGDCQVSGNGSINLTATGHNLILNGYNNIIPYAAFTAGSSSTVTYNAASDQAILNLPYNNLTINGGGIKSLTADLSVSNTLNIQPGAILEIGIYNYAVYTTSINGKLSKNSSTGTVNFTNGVTLVTSYTSFLSFTGSPTVNLSGNITAYTGNGVNFGSGFLNILTNSNWNLMGPGNAISSIGSMNVIIASGKTLTIGGYGWVNNGTINGVDGTSILNIDSSYGYANTNNPMVTGVFNYNHSGTSNIQIQSGVTMSLPFTSFYDLTNYGNITLSGNTTVGRNYTGYSLAALEMSSYDFTCSGTCTYNILTKSGGGTVNLNILYANPTVDGNKIDFPGNPTVNLAGNWTGDVRGGSNFGSNPVNIIANINLGLLTGGNTYPSTNVSLLIASGVTVKNIGLSSTTGGLGTTGVINGVDATSIFDNRSVLNYQNSQQPMQVGKLYCNQALNTFIYGLNNNQDISAPSDITPGYQNLTLNGSGAKRLLANISVKGIYTIISPVTLNNNGYSLTNP